MPNSASPTETYTAITRRFVAWVEKIQGEFGGFYGMNMEDLKAIAIFVSVDICPLCNGTGVGAYCKCAKGHALEWAGKHDNEGRED